MKLFGALAALVFALAVAATLSGCGGGSTAGNPNVSIEDTSASGAAASAVGGALSGSSGSSGLASLKNQSRAPATRTAAKLRELFDVKPVARAAVSCPSTLTASGEGCSASGDSLWLTLEDCAYGGSSTYEGNLELISSKALSCGAVPLPGANGILSRQYVNGSSSTTPGELVIQTAFGTTSTIDDASANLDNFDGATIASFINGGYGAQVSFGSNGARNGVTLGHHLEVSTGTDMSITGSVGITETPGATSRQITNQSQITIYHNLLKVVATSTFTNVVHEDGCCFPISGTVSTTFSQGSVTPTTDGSKMIGKTETLEITGCGTGTLQEYDGTVQDVTLSRCF